MESLLKIFKDLNWSNLYLSQRKMLKCVLLQKGISFWSQLDIFSLKRKSAAQVDTKSVLQRAVSPTGKTPEMKTSPEQWSISSASFPTVEAQKHEMLSISQAVFLRSFTSSLLMRGSSQCLLYQLVLGWWCCCVIVFVLLFFWIFFNCSEEKHNSNGSSANFSKIDRQSSLILLLGSIIIESKLHLSK